MVFKEFQLKMNKKNVQQMFKTPNITENTSTRLEAWIIVEMNSQFK